MKKTPVSPNFFCLRAILTALSRIALLSCAVVSLCSSATAQATVNFAYTANFESSNISAFAVDSSSGALTPINGSPFPSGTSPHCVTADPKGRFLYSADFYGNTVSAFRIDPTTGALTPVPGSPFFTGSFPRWVTVDAAGKVLYAANDGGNSTSAFSIDQATGALTPLNDSPYPSGNGAASGPQQIVLHPTGKFAYAPNRAVPLLTGYAVNPDGSLSQLPGSPFPTGGIEPIGVAITPDGSYAYLSNRSTGNVSAFSIDGQTGVPTLLPSSPFPSGLYPFYLSSDPLGTFLFVTNSGASTVGVYTVDTGSGVISQVAGSPFPTGVEPLTIAVSRDGRFAYVAAHTSSAVYGYSVDRPTGNLTQIAGSPWPTPQGPVTVALVTVASPYTATIQQPINSDGSSVFNASKGVIPVKFTINLNETATCQLPPATISLVRTAGGTIGAIDESTYLMAADNGPNFRISGCQYLYNLAASSLGSGTYRVDITINGAVAGSGVFALK